ncbi:hypothetical protein PVAG01_03817 [Phlyctema vagabunda]|uniref:Transmembrane protein n=1 Tax=Phlyctema vagabunda TaxID=108571 RepID=A0ABR4PNN2_9HELO
MTVLIWLVLNHFVASGAAFVVIISILWTLELQLYYQIIINRCAVVTENTKIITRLKWASAVFIGFINISVTIFWIPSMISPDSIPHSVTINSYWDRISKGLLLILDACLNIYFLMTVQKQLVKFHGLVKYAPLVRLNSWLMLFSVSLDGMLIGIESIALKEKTVLWQQFHPLTYLIKLQIELSLAALIAKLVKASKNGQSTYFNDEWIRNESAPSSNYSYSLNTDVERSSHYMTHRATSTTSQATRVGSEEHSLSTKKGGSSTSPSIEAARLQKFSFEAEQAKVA